MQPRLSCVGVLTHLWKVTVPMKGKHWNTQLSMWKTNQVQPMLKRGSKWSDRTFHPATDMLFSPCVATAAESVTVRQTCCKSEICARIAFQPLQHNYSHFPDGSLYFPSKLGKKKKNAQTSAACFFCVRLVHGSATWRPRRYCSSHMTSSLCLLYLC